MNRQEMIDTLNELHGHLNYLGGEEVDDPEEVMTELACEEKYSEALATAISLLAASSAPIATKVAVGALAAPYAIPVDKLTNLICVGMEVAGYWCRYSGSNRGVMDNLAATPFCGGDLIFYELEDRGAPPTMLILNLAAVERGLGLMHQGGPKIPSRHAERLLADGGDNETADVFLQLCLLGEIKYSQ